MFSQLSSQTVCLLIGWFVCFWGKIRKNLQDGFPQYLGAWGSIVQGRNYYYYYLKNLVQIQIRGRIPFLSLSWTLQDDLCILMKIIWHVKGTDSWVCHFCAYPDKKSASSLMLMWLHMRTVGPRWKYMFYWVPFWFHVKLLLNLCLFCYWLKECQKGKGNLQMTNLSSQ